ncbi:unnamed protein product [Scytosiphon promiscuus]
MFSGESKKRPTVSLRGKSKEEDRGEFLRRARAQREERARERLHVSCATTIQRIWRGRSCVGKWREAERNAWDRKMHDVGRVKSMLAAAGKVLQLPPPVLTTLLSQLVHFHSFPRDAGRFRAAIDLVLAAAPSDNATGATQMAAGLFAPAAAAAAAPARAKPTGRAGVGDGVGKEDTMDDIGAAAEASSRGFELLASPGAWRNRWPVVERGMAESRCRAFLASVALGRASFGAGAASAAGGVPRKSGGIEAAKSPPTRGKKAGSAGGRGVRLSVRAERDEVSGEWARTPRLFEVLRVVWDASATAGGTGGTGAGAGEGSPEAVRLLCGASFRALGIGGTPTVPPTGTSPAVSGAAGDESSRGESTEPEKGRRLLLLEAFAAAVLPAPRLLDHPLRELLSACVRRPFVGGGQAPAQAATMVETQTVDPRGISSPSAPSSVSAWCVQVDTGGSAERAPCLVRTLCILLRKVSLHALLQGAGTRGAGGGVQMDPHEVSGNDGRPHDEETEKRYTHVRSTPRRASQSSHLHERPLDHHPRAPFAIVRRHRRRCAIRTESLAAEQLVPPNGPGSSGPQLNGHGFRGSGGDDRRSGQTRRSGGGRPTLRQHTAPRRSVLLLLRTGTNPKRRGSALFLFCSACRWVFHRWCSGRCAGFGLFPEVNGCRRPPLFFRQCCFDDVAINCWSSPHDSDVGIMRTPNESTVFPPSVAGAR